MSRLIVVCTSYSLYAWCEVLRSKEAPAAAASVKLQFLETGGS